MATGQDSSVDDLDVEKLRLRALATLANAKNEKSPESDSAQTDEEDDLRALRDAALRTKKFDVGRSSPHVISDVSQSPNRSASVSAAASGQPFVERKGNLLVISVAPPEAERQTTVKKPINFANLSLSISAPLSQPATPPRPKDKFTRYEDSDSDDDYSSDSSSSSSDNEQEAAEDGRRMEVYEPEQEEHPDEVLIKKDDENQKHNETSSKSCLERVQESKKIDFQANHLQERRTIERTSLANSCDKIANTSKSKTIENSSLLSDIKPKLYVTEQIERKMTYSSDTKDDKIQRCDKHSRAERYRSPNTGKLPSPAYHIKVREVRHRSLSPSGVDKGKVSQSQLSDGPVRKSQSNILESHGCMHRSKSPVEKLPDLRTKLKPKEPTKASERKDSKPALGEKDRKKTEATQGVLEARKKKFEEHANIDMSKKVSLKGIADTSAKKHKKKLKKERKAKDKEKEKNLKAKQKSEEKGYYDKKPTESKKTTKTEWDSSEDERTKPKRGRSWSDEDDSGKEVAPWRMQHTGRNKKESKVAYENDQHQNSLARVRNHDRQMLQKENKRRREHLSRSRSPVARSVMSSVVAVHAAHNAIPEDAGHSAADDSTPVRDELSPSSIVAASKKLHKSNRVVLLASDYYKPDRKSNNKLSKSVAKGHSHIPIQQRLGSPISSGSSIGEPDDIPFSPKKDLSSRLGTVKRRQADSSDDFRRPAKRRDEKKYDDTSTNKSKHERSRESELDAKMRRMKSYNEKVLRRQSEIEADKAQYGRFTPITKKHRRSAR